MKLTYEQIEAIAHRVCKDYTHSENESDRVYAFDKNTLLQFVQRIVETSNQWLPIESAPTDGTRFVGAYKYKEVWFAEVCGDHTVNALLGKEFPATYWMPLPPTPTR